MMFLVTVTPSYR